MTYEVRSYPFSPFAIFALLFLTFFIVLFDKVLFEHLYKPIYKGEIIIEGINGIFIFIIFHLLVIFPPNFWLIFALLYVLSSRIYINNYGIIVKYFFKTHIIPWEKVRNCYWQETPEGDLYHVLVIETFEKQFKLGPEWTNRETLMKYVQKEIRKRESPLI